MPKNGPFRTFEPTGSREGGTVESNGKTHDE
jgi:hypothetical protein